MPKKYKVVVGVLYCGEADYESCIKAIKAQTGVDIELLIIRDRPNKAAHDELYAGFMQRSVLADFFAKVDADMVVRETEFLSKIGLLFEQNPTVKMVTVPVSDFFTGTLIQGLNCFRRDVTWTVSSDRVFVDRPPVDGNERLVAHHLAPAALHCFHAAGFHAYHYGVHRGLKLRTALLSKNEHSMRRFHVLNYFNLVRNAPLGAGVDRRLLLARYGMASSLLGAFDHSVVEYSNPTLRLTYEQNLDELSSDRLAAMIRDTERYIPAQLKIKATSAFLGTIIRRKLSVLRRSLIYPSRISMQ
jgi:hypothetical protein